MNTYTVQRTRRIRISDVLTVPIRYPREERVSPFGPEMFVVIAR